MWDSFLALLDEDLNAESNSSAQASLNLISSCLSYEVTSCLVCWDTVKSCGDLEPVYMEMGEPR